MYGFAKLFAPIATPLGLAFVALIFAGFSARRAARFLYFIPAALLLWFGSDPGSRLVVVSLENSYPNITPAASPTAPAIVVLDGGLVTINDPAGAIELGQSSDRLWMAAQLYRAGKSPLILISGFGEPGAARILIDWGIPPAAILTEQQSRDTHQNAVFTQRILAQRGIAKILLVTSAFHMPRAAAAFRRTGLTVIPIPADYLTGPDNDTPLLLRLLPTAGALNNSGIAIKEYLGLLAYRLRNWA